MIDRYEGEVKINGQLIRFGGDAVLYQDSYESDYFGRGVSVIMPAYADTAQSSNSSEEEEENNNE